ncbi:MAG TPA: DUF3224 domain-containing protein [Acidobacterium sp.]|uniref:DUF3224 domain-containing protein n=2 Tax=Acidobacteriaceae TaxID=204434 RepID=C1F7V1_ACIC5|nr:conserved hypothetical protein [Acidobacterium capsulatum ATCC 51196]HCT59716.1 DUF3224 domain-containing protein [Acidobacterium sp.]
MHHAHGTFTVEMKPAAASPAEGLTTFTMQKKFEGDLTGTGQGEMISAGDYKAGAAGYVAIETVTGTLDGRQGSFALAQLATVDASGPRMQVIVVPGSGTGALKGIGGTFTISIEHGQHFYQLDYTLPE